MNPDISSASRDTPSSVEKDVTSTEHQEYAWTSESLEDPLGDDIPMAPGPILVFGGYPGDKSPAKDGVYEVSTAVKMLDAAGVPCCVVGEPALLFYGAKRVMFDWSLCVPTDKLKAAAQLFLAQPEVYEEAAPNQLRTIHDLSHLYPRIKFKGLNLFLLLLTDEACHLPCERQKFDYSDNGIPYLKLQVFAQSLLDIDNYVDLEDLIDGMNLTLEWGEEFLDLEGSIDQEWRKWRAERLGGIWSKKYIKPCNRNPIKKRDLWKKKSSDEAKRLRQGYKYRPDMITRFWRVGRQDPRIRTRKNR